MYFLAQQTQMKWLFFFLLQRKERSADRTHQFKVNACVFHISNHVSKFFPSLNFLRNRYKSVCVHLGYIVTVCKLNFFLLDLICILNLERKSYLAYLFICYKIACFNSFTTLSHIVDCISLSAWFRGKRKKIWPRTTWECACLNVPASVCVAFVHIYYIPTIYWAPCSNDMTNVR